MSRIRRQSGEVIYIEMRNKTRLYTAEAVFNAVEVKNIG